jgi:2-polyprenyl-3-methyl-5-hydroxy-6-metoxy-1,4-benzoquinol methylase
MKSDEFIEWLDRYFLDNNLTSDFDLQFAKRNYSDSGGEIPSNRFLTRLRMMGCVNQERVLDFGAGFGQWSIAASKLNKNVLAMEPDLKRVQFVNDVKELLLIPNLQAKAGTLEDIAKEPKFNFILSYGVLPFLDWRLALQNFYTALEPGGILYFNSYDIGWILKNILENPNHNQDFSSRKWAFQTWANTLRQEITRTYSQKNFLASVYISKKNIDRELKKIGFEIICEAGDGKCDVSGSTDLLPFFNDKFLNLPSVYEFICMKPKL